MTRKIKSKKGMELAVNTLFYIFMGIMMIAILVFGFQKIFLVENTLSEQERIEIKNQIKAGLKYCEDPLNAGTKKIYEIKSNSFNSICYLGDDFKNDRDYIEAYPDVSEIAKAGSNIVLVYTKSYEENNGDYIFNEYQIIDALSVEYLDNLETSQCFFAKPNSNKIELEINC